MAKTNDTTDGLLSEFRGYSAGMPPSYHVTMSWADFRKMLDRFDVAHKREIEDAERRGNHAATKAICETIEKVGPLYDAESVGNAAKLREALEYLRDASREFCHLILNSKHNEVFDKYKYAEVAKIRDSIANANAALAAPPRNCDMGTVGQQDERFTAFCNRHFSAVGLCDKSCPCRDFNMIGGACPIVWGQLPYVEKEGSAK